jgi:DNA-directed RNA polymerase specialized sigma24 family protein
MSAQLSRLLETFLAGLDETQRRIVEAHLMGELSQNEIAAELGVDRNHVRKEVRLLRERLLRHLKSEGFIPTLDPKAALSLVTLVLTAGGRL